MAKEVKAAKAEKQESKTRKYRVAIDKKASYRGDIRDTKGNILQSFFFVDLSRTWEEAMRDHFERQLEHLGENDVVAKPGEVIELLPPDKDGNVLGGYNAAYQLLRAGVIKEA
jgi:hypothetical protein